MSVKENQKKDEQNQDLRLHRKYLYVLCLTLWLLDFGEIQLQDVKFIFTSAPITNPIPFYIAIWIVFVYSLLRYWQFYRTNAYTIFKVEYQQLKNAVYQSKIDKIIKSNHSELIEKLRNYDRSSHIQNPHYSQFQNHNLDSKTKRIGFINVSSQKQDIYQLAKDNPITIDFNWRFIQQKLLTWLFTITNRPALFNYIFPPIVAILTFIIIGLLTTWPGNILCLILNRNC